MSKSHSACILSVVADLHPGMRCSRSRGAQGFSIGSQMWCKHSIPDWTGKPQCVSDETWQILQNQQAQARRAQTQQKQAELDQQRAEADAARAQAEAKEHYQKLIADGVSMERQLGYNPTSINDFKLDGRELTSSQAKIAIAGVYVKRGQVELLFPSTIAALISHETGADDTAIAIVTDDAARAIRQYLLNCVGNYSTSISGCALTVMGHASVCTRTTLLGANDEPCVIVEHGWHIDQTRNAPDGG
jgi:hypothetical protein